MAGRKKITRLRSTEVIKITNIEDIQKAFLDDHVLLVNNRDFLHMQGFDFVNAMVKYAESLSIPRSRWIFDINDNLHMMEQISRAGFSKITANLQGEALKLYTNKAIELGIEMYELIV